MQSLLNEPEPDVWPQIAPLLDAAMARLGEKDRNAIVLRFFENKSLGEVGRALGASEDAAKMRVNRALEKLRKFFTKRGVALSGAVIAGAVSANSVHAAPVGLAITVTAAAAKGSAAGGFNPNPGKRSIETYGLDKNENRRRYRRGRTSDRRHRRRRGQNRSCGAVGGCAGHSRRLGRSFGYGWNGGSKRGDDQDSCGGQGFQKERILLLDRRHH